MSKLELKYSDDNKKIYAPLKDKWLEARPEEIVRQEFICKLVNDYGYKLEQMEQEKNLTEYSDRGTGQASADIIIWKSKEEKEKEENAFLIVECKAKNIKLKDKDYFQGANYARWAGAKVLVVTNGNDEKYFEILEKKLPFSKKPISNIPNADIINDNEKLQEELLKTTTFKKDEFAKLLHKCHNIIRDIDKLDPADAFDEISKILFIKIRYEREENNNIFSLEKFKKLKESYNEIKSKDSRPFYQQLFENTKKDFIKDDLFANNETIKIKEGSFEKIVEELQKYDLSNTSDDVKGIAFEKFLGTTFRGELGQFFTPRVIVDFMVELLEPKEGESICDPCSGSGGFLIKAFEFIRKQIEDEIETKIEELQKEYYGENLEKIDDEEINEVIEKEIQKLKNQLKLSKNRDDIKTRIDKLSKSCIFGTDGNSRMARVSKMNMIMHGDGHGGVHHNDGLLNINGIFENRFDLIVTNPPFGSRVDKNLKIEESDKYKDEEKKQTYIKKYGNEYLEALKQVENNIGKSLISLYDVGKYSSLTEVLFMERCLKLLKDGGRMGIVLPEGVLNSSNLESVREYFEARAKILLIVSLPQEIFISSGASVKTSLVFMKKFDEEEKKKYQKIKDSVTNEINKKYEGKINLIKNKLNLRGEKALNKEEKRELRAELKEIELKKSKEIRELIKEKFDYEVPIADIKKAGISAIGTKIDNELPKLLKEFTEYRKFSKLWEEKK